MRSNLFKNESGVVVAGALAFFALFGLTGAVAIAPLAQSTNEVSVAIERDEDVLDFVGALSSPQMNGSYAGEETPVFVGALSSPYIVGGLGNN